MEMWPTQRPAPAVIEIAERIRFMFGIGGADFPGARELYEAASKIERWEEATRIMPPRH